MSFSSRQQEECSTKGVNQKQTLFVPWIFKKHQFRLVMETVVALHYPEKIKRYNQPGFIKQHSYSCFLLLGAFLLNI